MNSPIIIHHAPCIDGTVAAWVAWNAFDGMCDLVPAKYGDPPPDVTGRHVYILDFSYPRTTLIELAAKAEYLKVLDHHKTAEEDLRGLEFCEFDMSRSGAGMAWDYFRADEPRPWLVNYVEDRDLWRFKIHASKEVNAFIGLYAESTMAEWDDLAAKPFEEVIAAGVAVQRKIGAYVDGMSKQSLTRRIAGHDVPVVNAPYINTSELVGHLAESATFAVGWYQRSDGLFAYSLRSRGDYDVSRLAQLFGGGGHRNAAGFQHVYPPWELFTGNERLETP